MAYLVRWWLLAELLGLFALPLCHRIFRRLPDRGYGFSKIVGLLCVAYLSWAGGALGLLPFSAGSVLLSLLVLAVVAGSFARSELPLLRTAWRQARRYVICAEAVFLAALLAVALLRSYAPQIDSTEKPFEFANYNAVNRTEFFAPTDPWMAGRSDAYYYYGYVVANSAAKLTGTPPEYAFNLSLIMIAGVTAFTAFGLSANAAALLGRRRVEEAWPLLAAAGGVALLMVIGNLEGVLELGAAHGWNPSWVYEHMDIAGAGGLHPRASAHWYPSEAGFGSWWRATRLGSDWNFLEFPFFSFLLGDLHPHVLSLPFKFLAGGFALAAGMVESLPGPGSWRRGWLFFGSAALALGALIAVHPWDFPPFALLFLLVILWRQARQREPLRLGLQRFAAVGLILVPLCLLLYLPYLASGGRGAVKGIQATQPYLTSLQSLGAVNAEATYLPFQHLLLFWAPLMLPVTAFVGWALARRGWQAAREFGIAAAGLVALLPIVWLVVVLTGQGTDGLANELQVRGWGWLTVFSLGALLAAAVAAFLGELRQEEPSEHDQVIAFLLAATIVALLLVYGPELFMVKDSSGTRANSTFKLWYDAWALLSVVGAVGGGWALLSQRHRIGGLALLRPVGATACAVTLAASLIYTADAWANRASQAYGAQTLNGLTYLRTADPDEFGAVQWLNQNVSGVETVLQGVGQSYEPAARISARTGLPTALEWPFHEQQLRGSDDPQIAQRQQDVAAIYTTPDTTLAFQLLSRYAVRYVVVGQPERQLYGTAGLPKFADMGNSVFSSPTVTIYRVGRAPLFGAVR